MFMNKKALIILLLALFCVSITSCVQSPVEIQKSPPDSAWKVIENLTLAYQIKNVELFSDCLHDEFEFFLLPEDSVDYNGDGIADSSWGRSIEIELTENMFNSPNAEIIDLILEGNMESVWYGDSTGTTLMLVRSFWLKIYYWDPDQGPTGYSAEGIAVFLCKPDSTGEYKIWRWLDQSEI